MSSRQRSTRSGARDEAEDVREPVEAEEDLEAVITAPTFADAKDADPLGSAVEESTLSEQVRLGHV